MLMRHWATAAFFSGFILCLPGVVFASGKHDVKGHNHGQALGYEKVVHTDKSAKKLVKVNKKTVMNKTEHPVAKVKHLVDHASDSAQGHGQSAVHASQKALDHASSHLAVHASASNTVKVPSKASSFHTNLNRNHTSHVKKPVKSKHKANLDSVKFHLAEKKIIKPKTHLLKKNQSKLEISQKTQDGKHHTPISDLPSVPAAILISVANGSGPSAHTQPMHGQGTSGQHGFSNLWVLPSSNNNGNFSLGSVVSRISQYRSQWIHAPPSPPPRMASSFS